MKSEFFRIVWVVIMENFFFVNILFRHGPNDWSHVDFNGLFKRSISLTGSIWKPIKPSSTAADIPDALQQAKMIYFPCDEVNLLWHSINHPASKGFIVNKRNLMVIFSNSFPLSNSFLNFPVNHSLNFCFIKSFTHLLTVRSSIWK